MKMKTLKFTTLAICLSLSFIGIAQNYFVDGTIWESEVWDTQYPKIHSVTERVWLSESTSHEFLEMYCQYDESSDDSQFVAFVKTAEDKVYFKLNSDESSEWFLFYNFNLKEGEGCYVYSPNYSIEKTPFQSYLKCTGLTETSKGTEMLLQQYEDETCQGVHYDGVWLKGIGSLSGVLNNNRFGMIGSGSKLANVVSGDKTIYSARQSAGISSNPDVPLIEVRVIGNNLYVESEQIGKGYLYTQSGICIDKLELKNVPYAIEALNPGVYILSAEGVYKKIIIY